ncbi:MAG: hypothetical protein VX938_04530, partial [Myxococcota bacterium]|nr:hypothetical protein [Myxococcota bacterium]
MKPWWAVGCLLLLVIPACSSDPAADNQISFVEEADSTVTDPNNLTTTGDTVGEVSADASSAEVLEDVPPTPEDVTPEVNPDAVEDAGPEIAEEVVDPDAINPTQQDAETIEEVTDDVIDEGDGDTP